MIHEHLLGKEAEAAPTPKQRPDKSKADRRNAARQQQRTKRQALMAATRQMQHIPKNVLIVPLGRGLTAEDVLLQVLHALQSEATLQLGTNLQSEAAAGAIELVTENNAALKVVHGIYAYESNRFRHQKINFLLCERVNYYNIL
jgi:hypothetical protein